MTDLDAVVHDAAELVVGPAAGTTEGNHPGGDTPPSDPDAVLERYSDGAIAVVDGTVAAVGPSEEVTREYPPAEAEVSIDATGTAVIPGFVDSHSHAAFVGDRSDEFAAKLRGATYQEIHEEGGGILRTVRAVREASEEELLDRLLAHLDTMCAHGATTIEVKSGYGLDVETELRLLSAIGRANDRHPARILPTFMGAHAVPDGQETDDYVDEVVSEQLPAVAEQDVAAFCDVFCEAGVFSVDQSRRVLEAGVEHGLTPKLHAEEFERIGGAALAAELRAVSADHLLQATDADAEALANAGVVPTLLPGTAFALGTDYAEPRQFLRAGAEVAIASDFNPNCHAPGMDFATTLACVGMRLSPAEAIRAGTYGGALALGAGEQGGDDAPVPAGTGTLREGAPGDILVCDAPSHAHVPYRFGERVIQEVLISGQRAEVGP